MNFLIFNCGSSSLNYKVYGSDGAGKLDVMAQGKAYHVGVKSQEASYLVQKAGGTEQRVEAPFPDHRQAGLAALRQLERAEIRADVVGHRFVHGGTLFQETAWITDEALGRLEQCTPLAPIHNPNSLSVIHLCREELPGVRQYASFDTAFHASLPEKSYRYALPVELADPLGLRKYGFHGLSYQYVSGQVSTFLGKPLEDLKIVACHLGTGGSSAAAIDRGRSVETSMGYSPLAGLMMSTRSGDLDPAIPLMLIEEHGYTAGQLNRILNKDSGLIGIAGGTSDLFEILRRADEGDGRARLAVEMYAYRLKMYIGAFVAVLGGIDALAFTDDIGLRAWQIRALACSGLEAFGVAIDPQANQAARADRISRVSPAGAKVSVLAVPTDEELVIAQEGVRLVEQAGQPNG